MITITTPELDQRVNTRRPVRIQWTDTNDDNVAWNVRYRSGGAGPFTLIAVVNEKSIDWQPPAWYRAASLEIEVTAGDEDLLNRDVSLCQGYPQGAFRLRWFEADDTTLVATEEWGARNTDYRPGSALRGAATLLDGLSVGIMTGTANPRRLVLPLKGEGMAVRTAERIAERYAGINLGQEWNGLPLHLDDQFGMAWTVKLAEAPVFQDRGRIGLHYEFRFLVVTAPDALILGYC